MAEELLEWVVTKSVGTRGATQATIFDESPNGANVGDQPNQTPPTRLISVMPALDLNGKAHPKQRDQENEKYDGAD